MECMREEHQEVVNSLFAAAEARPQGYLRTSRRGRHPAVHLSTTHQVVLGADIPLMVGRIITDW